MDDTAVRLSHVTKTFYLTEIAASAEMSGQIRDGFFYALDDVSLCLSAGKCAVLAGANGSGKSLLMTLIAALEDPSAGTISVSGKVGLVFQDADSQILGETAREDVALGIQIPKKQKDARAGLVEKVLAQTGLTAKADFPARSLSGGEKRRLAVAGVLAMDASIIIFDEPYANLDYPGVRSVNALIIELIRLSKTIVILTHELEKCLALAQHLIILHKGKAVFDGLPEDALALGLNQWDIHDPLCAAARYADLVWL